MCIIDAWTLCSTRSGNASTQFTAIDFSDGTLLSALHINLPLPKRKAIFAARLSFVSFVVNIFLRVYFSMTLIIISRSCHVNISKVSLSIKICGNKSSSLYWFHSGALPDDLSSFNISVINWSLGLQMKSSNVRSSLFPFLSW